MARRVGFGDKGRDERAKRLVQEDQSGWAPYLDDDETILWTGHPEPGFAFRSSDIFKSVFGLFFLSFAIFWTYMASSIGGQGGLIANFFPLFGLPFIFVGAYLLFGRFFWEAHVRRNTRYALTNRRAIIAKSATGRSMTSHPITNASAIELQVGPPDTVTFATRFVRSKHGGHNVPIGFERIADGTKAYKVLRDIKRSAL